MDRLTSMAVFVRTVDKGSLSAAAREFRISPAMAGKHLRALEDCVGTALLQRTTRRHSLTEVGKVYYERCVRILGEVEEADRCATPFNAEPRGGLRITSPSSFGVRLLTPMVAEFLARYPKVAIELVLTDRVVNLVEEGFDVAVRVGALAPSQLIARRLADSSLVLAASPEYLRDRGTPRRPEDLARHMCLTDAHGALSTAWTLVDAASGAPHSVRVRSALRVNHGMALAEAAARGAGIVLQPEYVLDADLRAGRLVRVLPRCGPPAVPVHIVFPPQRPAAPKLRAWVDFAVAKLGTSLVPPRAHQPAKRSRRSSSK
jgi:DNA-binding transcriptional LysR family regulator